MDSRNIGTSILIRIILLRCHEDLSLFDLGLRFGMDVHTVRKIVKGEHPYDFWLRPEVNQTEEVVDACKEAAD